MTLYQVIQLTFSVAIFPQKYFVITIKRFVFWYSLLIRFKVWGQ
jgi:hypothetical protein